MTITARRRKVPIRALLVALISIGCALTAQEEQEDAPSLEGPPGGLDSWYYKQFKTDFGKKADSGSFTGDFECASCAQSKVSLTIIPEKRAHRADWRNALNPSKPKRGHIVAKIINNEKVRYVPLELDGGKEVYMWVGPLSGDDNTRGVAYYRLENGGLSASKPMSPARYARHCVNDDADKRTVPAVKDKNPGSHSCTPLRVASASEIKPLYPPGNLWVSCSGGCCEVGDGTRMSIETTGPRSSRRVATRERSASALSLSNTTQ